MNARGRLVRLEDAARSARRERDRQRVRAILALLASDPEGPRARRVCELLAPANDARAYGGGEDAGHSQQG